jgi:hypothetical protein
MMNNMN